MLKREKIFRWYRNDSEKEVRYIDEDKKQINKIKKQQVRKKSNSMM